MTYLLHHLLEDSARRFPGRPAVVDGGRTVTYAQLDERANRLAHLLVDAGVRRGDRVALYLDKSLESLVAIYGILKSGAAYVPFDPQAPVKRLAYMVTDAGIRCVVTAAAKKAAWAPLVDAAAVEVLVVLDGGADGTDVPGGVTVLTAEDVDRRPATSACVDAIDLDLAYILYTSGSTGAPKGVMLSHLNALVFVEWAVDRFEVSHEDRLSSHAPLHFDLSIFDIFAAAAAGAAVVLVPSQTAMFPADVAAFIDDYEITVWYSVPSILSMMTQRGALDPGRFPRLRTILFAGEVFPTKYLRRLMELVPHVRLFNLYGPTETNVCTYYEVTRLAPDQTEPIPIGAAIDDVEVFAVNEAGAVARRGEVGELYVRGSTVMKGYWGDPDRTARSLVPNPLPGGGHDRVYRTGDLVRLGDDGNYRLVGRRDHQIKSRGYRIELGEIEIALYAHPQVDECAVVAVPDELITNRIKAFVAARDGVTQGELMRFVAQRIPRYMIPEAFEFLPSLPKTSTGKIDRQALGRTAAPAAPAEAVRNLA